ncbi:MAG: hypothetical protein RLZZ453_880 [Chlamydiota bacterium]|jgi:hypothetical protein
MNRISEGQPPQFVYMFSEPIELTELFRSYLVSNPYLEQCHKLVKAVSFVLCGNQRYTQDSLEECLFLIIHDNYWPTEMGLDSSDTIINFVHQALSQALF